MRFQCKKSLWKYCVDSKNNIAGLFIPPIREQVEGKKENQKDFLNEKKIPNRKIGRDIVQLKQNEKKCIFVYSTDKPAPYLKGQDTYLEKLRT